jgi:hypothetical protein
MNALRALVRIPAAVLTIVLAVAVVVLLPIGAPRVREPARVRKGRAPAYYLPDP